MKANNETKHEIDQVVSHYKDTFYTAEYPNKGVRVITKRYIDQQLDAVNFCLEHSFSRHNEALKFQAIKDFLNSELDKTKSLDRDYKHTTNKTTIS